MKHTGIIALISLLFAGCSVMPECFSDAPVDKDAPVYISCQPASLAADWEKYFDAVISSEAKNSQNDKTQVIKKFLYLKLLLHYAGISEINDFKASSNPVADCRFDNRVAISTSGVQTDGISLFGDNCNLYSALAELPEECSFAMAFSINLVPVWKTLKQSQLEIKNKIIANASLLLKSTPEQLVRSHNGIWIFGTDHPAREEQIFLSIPDKDQQIYSRFNSIACSRKKEHISVAINPLGLHIRHKEGRTFIFNSETYLARYFSSPRKLGDNADFIKLKKETANPAVFLSWTSAKRNIPTLSGTNKNQSEPEYFCCSRTKYGFYGHGLEKNNWMTELFRDDLLAVLNWLPMPESQNSENNQPLPSKISPASQNSTVCNSNMFKLARALKAYASANGGIFPEGMYIDGLNKLVSTPAWNNKFLCCPDSGCDSAPSGKPIMAENTGYVYFGNWENGYSQKLPLIMDMPENHNGFFYAVLNDGSVKKFIFKQQMSLKRMASYLHTVFQYDEKSFSELIRRAEELDKILDKESK